MLRLIIACNYCIHKLLLFLNFCLPYVGYCLRYNYTCTGSVEAEEVVAKSVDVQSLWLFPKLALPEFIT